MNFIASYNLILPKYMIKVKRKGSKNPKARAREGWGKRNYSFFSFGPAVRSQKILAVQAGGQKGRGLGGRNFCPHCQHLRPASVPVPFEQEKSGRGVWGEFRRVLAKDRGRTRHLAIHCKTPQKNTLFIRRKRNRAAETAFRHCDL